MKNVRIIAWIVAGCSLFSASAIDMSAFFHPKYAIASAVSSTIAAISMAIVLMIEVAWRG